MTMINIKASNLGLHHLTLKMSNWFIGVKLNTTGKAGGGGVQGLRHSAEQATVSVCQSQSAN